MRDLGRSRFHHRDFTSWIEENACRRRAFCHVVADDDGDDANDDDGVDGDDDEGDVDLQEEGMEWLVSSLKVGKKISFQGNHALVVKRNIVSLWGEDCGGEEAGGLRGGEMEGGWGGGAAVPASSSSFVATQNFSLSKSFTVTVTDNIR